MANIYHANFHSESYRSSRPANAIKFGAADDGTAAAVVAELANWTTGRLTSLYKTLGFNNALAYPVGTRRTMAALMLTATGAAYKVRLRNLAVGITEADVSNLLLGTTLIGGSTVPFTALSGPPSIPGGAAFASLAAPGFVTKY